MRVKHELDKGVVCEKCNQIATKESYKRLNTLAPIVEDSTGRFKSIDRYNLCTECYEKYKVLLNKFLDKEAWHT